jgi:LCP family protein required for cell wall assembly
VADRPHGSSASSDADWFSHPSRERTGRHHSTAAPPPSRGRAAVTPQPTSPPATSPPAQPPPAPSPPAGTGHGRTRSQAGGSRRAGIQITGRQSAAPPHDGRTSAPDARRHHATPRHPGSHQTGPQANPYSGHVHSAPAQAAPHNTGSHHTGLHDTGSYNTGSHHTGLHDTGSYNTGSHHTGSHDTGSYSTRSHHTGSHDTGLHNTGSHHTGSHHTGSYSTGYHDTGSQDTGQWRGEPALPRRRRRDSNTGPQTYDPARQTQRPTATPFAEDNPYDTRWATGQQPAEFGQFLAQGTDSARDTSGRHTHDRRDTGYYAPGPHTGELYGGHHPAVEPQPHRPDGHPSGQHPDHRRPPLDHPLERDAHPSGALPVRAAAAPHPAQARPPARRARKHHRTVRVVATGLAVAILLGTGFGWATKRWAQTRFKQVAALELGSPAIINGAAQRGDDNFLVLGLDGRPGAETEDPAGGVRADTAMVVHVPQDRGRVVVVSFPSDLLVDRPACEGWDAGHARYTGQRDPGQPKAPLSTAYRAGGPRCVTRVVQQLSGLAINHFVGIDFAGFRSVVDTIGGVQLCVDQPVRDDVLGEVVAAPGNVHLSGEQALAFVRASHVPTDPPAEHGRVLRQQQLLAAVARAATSDGGPDAHRIVDALAGRTLVDNVDAGQLLGLATALNEMDPGRLAFVPVPADPAPADPAPAGPAPAGPAPGNAAAPAPGGSEPGETLRAEDAAALFTALVDGNPLPGERPGPTAPAAGGQQLTTVPPAQIKLQVQNGTGQDGLATQITKRLRGVGFEVVQLGNAERTDRTVIRFGTSREAQARSVAAAIPRAALQLDPAMGGAIEVVVGSDFDGIIQPVQPGQPVPGQPVEAAPDPAAIQLDVVNGAASSCS